MIWQCIHICTSAEEFKNWKRALILQIEKEACCIMCQFFQPLLNVWRTKSLLTWLFDIKKRGSLLSGSLSEWNMTFLNNCFFFPQGLEFCMLLYMLELIKAFKGETTHVELTGGHYDVCSKQLLHLLCVRQVAYSLNSWSKKIWCCYVFCLFF